MDEGRPSRGAKVILLRTKRVWLVVAVVLLAAVLRLSRLDLMEFKADEAQAAVLVVKALSGEGLPTHGLMSSVGIYNPPTFIYLMLLPGLVSFDPIHLTQFVAALNILATFLCYWFGRRIFNEWVGLAGALLFATCPWAVIYSRKIWAQDCLPIFSLLVIGGLYEVCANGNRRWSLPALLAAGLMPGVHFSGLFAVAVTIITLAICRPKTKWWDWAIAAAILLATYLPYLLTHWGRGGMGSSASIARLSVAGCLYALQLLSHFNFSYLLGASAEQFYADGNGTIVVSHVLGAGLVGLAVAGFAGLAIRLAHRTKRLVAGEAEASQDRGKLICFLWVALPLVGYVVLSVDKPIHPHYLIILYPVPFWLAAAALDWLARRGRPKWRHIATAVVIAIALSEVLFLARFAAFVGREGGTTGDYGVAYRYKLGLANHIVAMCAAGRAEPDLVSPSNQNLLDYQYLVMLFGREALPGPGHGSRRILFEIVERGDRRKADPAEEAKGRSFGPVRVYTHPDPPRQ